MNDKQIDDAGREIERKNADAGLDVEAVLRLFLTGDGFIAECDIPHIVAALTATKGKAMNDVLNDALSNLEHDNYERSHKGYENRQADIALIRAALAAQPAASAEPRASTHAADCWSWGPKHYECAVGEIERLREQLRLATVDQVAAEAEASDAHAENKLLRDAVPAAQAPRACTCHPDDRPDGHCRERYAASECQALAAQAQTANADANMNKQIAAAIARAIGQEG